MKIDDIKDGEWIRPKKRGWKQVCCDCGLVHRFDFKRVGGEIYLRTFRDNRATGQVRRWKNEKT